jgi:hypothetical protein
MPALPHDLPDPLVHRSESYDRMVPGGTNCQVSRYIFFYSQIKGLQVFTTQEILDRLEVTLKRQVKDEALSHRYLECDLMASRANSSRSAYARVPRHCSFIPGYVYVSGCYLWFINL